MAKNIGLIKISGKVGDLQFFTKDGKTYVGLTSSISKDRIAKDPAFKRTRENNSEFGGAAKVSKSVRDALIPLKKLIEKDLHNRMVKLTRELINSGSGARGKRKVEFSLNTGQIEGFELNPSSKVIEVFYVAIDVTTNSDRNQLTLVIDEFIPSDYMTIPEGATHFRIHLAGLALSDFAPIGPKALYKPTNAAQHGSFNKTTSVEFPVDQIVSGGINLTTALPNTPVLSTDVTLVAFVGVEFLQEVNGLYYTFASNNAIRIEKLF